MTTREKLHQIIDELSGPEVDEALQYISWQRGDSFLCELDSQPKVDSALTDADQATSDESEEQATSGRLIFFDEIKRKHGQP